MGLVIKKTTIDASKEEDLAIGDEVEIIATNEVGQIVMKIKNLYQIQKTDGTLRSYTREEIKK